MSVWQWRRWSGYGPLVVGLVGSANSSDDRVGGDSTGWPVLSMRQHTSLEGAISVSLECGLNGRDETEFLTAIVARKATVSDTLGSRYVYCEKSGLLSRLFARSQVRSQGLAGFPLGLNFLDRFFQGD